MSKASRARRDRLDQEYRRALGLDDKAEIPNEIGTQSSAGGARGGRGAAGKGRGRRK